MGVGGYCLDDLCDLSALAQGSFGNVYRCKRKRDGYKLALKQVPVDDMTEKEYEEAFSEANVLSQLNSRWVIQYFDCFMEHKKLNILMQLAEHGTLHARIRSTKNGFSEQHVWWYFIQALLGLAYVHQQNIIHRDVKSLNYFIDQNECVLIGDMGIAKVLSNKTKFARTFVGTPYYLSPEQCKDSPYNKRSDVWALGVVLYELCTATYPFDAQNEGALIRKIMRGVYPPLPQNRFSSALDSLLADILTVDYRKRPDCDTLLRNSAVRSKSKALGITLDPKLPREEASNGTIAPTNAGIVAEKDAPAKQRKLEQKAADGEHEDGKSEVLNGEPERAAREVAAMRVSQGRESEGHESKQLNICGTGNERQQEREEDANERELAAKSAKSNRKPSSQAQDDANVRPAGIARTKSAGPFARDEKASAGTYMGFRAAAPEQSPAVQQANYQAPRYGRRRNPDLMMTGPSPRESFAGRPASAGANAAKTASAQPRQAAAAQPNVQMPKGPESTTTTTTTTTAARPGTGG